MRIGIGTSMMWLSVEFDLKAVCGDLLLTMWRYSRLIVWLSPTTAFWPVFKEKWRYQIGTHFEVAPSLKLLVLALHSIFQSLRCNELTVLVYFPTNTDFSLIVAYFNTCIGFHLFLYVVKLRLYVATIRMKKTVCPIVARCFAFVETKFRRFICLRWYRIPSFLLLLRLLLVAADTFVVLAWTHELFWVQCK